MLDSLIRSMMGLDRGLATRVKVGDRVRHFNTRQWGDVLEVRPQSDGTAELRVKRDPNSPGAGMKFDGEGWWATYQIDEYEPKS